ncbi:hypothetical protein [Dictyobacter aurantiacus]|uniref:Uncharacterized protein n=1 Tax=Dictyobacter aurantiacus TaxID=1936993 RepID=A0A401ZRJ6_9CHLR|nr:hypothetical protein [Dictyobacter aurantiacus]GCE09491.1 hypothetical protein KDAU_68200 [Dictyobacter aurantiacus]
MTMQAFIGEYIEIESNPRYHRQRGRLMSDLLGRYPNLEQTSFADLLMMLDQLKSHQASIRMPLFAQVIYPVLAREIESGNAQAIKVLLEHTQSLIDYNRMKKIRNGYTNQTLIDRYLQYDPNDRDVLLKKHAYLDNVLYYALHELPSGVLYGISGATLDECQELLADLSEYTMICQKLQLDCEADIQYYAAHLHGYRDYHLHRHLYKNYADYIQQHQLELRTTRIYYFRRR